MPPTAASCVPATEESSTRPRAWPQHRRTIHLLPDGTTLTARALQKVRRQEQGHSYVEKRLIAFSATVPRAGVDHRAWLEEALHTAGVRRLRHPGTHRYAFPTGPARRSRQAVRIGLPELTYPKQIDFDT